jgi:crotonobetainyl-CoA:carnitine CoA-transferase CaiB-like acyl-CoA transferase
METPMTNAAPDLLSAIWRALGGEAKSLARVKFTGEGALRSIFAVTDLAAASIGAASLAIAEYASAGGSATPAVSVDRRLASYWFGFSIKPIGWSLAPAWDAIAGDYACADGWIRLHTNAAHHREAALAVLGTDAEKQAVRAAVERWKADELEAAVIARGGCAATMRSLAAWSAHPQGAAVASEPLMSWEAGERSPAADDVVDRARPLAGLRVLDMTRILAGPIATRFLAGFGADVLRIDPPDWDEPTIAPEVTLGKRCARLDLGDAGDKERWLGLLSQADIVIHGYRPDAAIVPMRWSGSGSARRLAAAPGRG